MLGLGLLLAVDRPGLLEAAGAGTGEDPDRDGLVTLQEKILGTNPQLADSDGDGYGDLEELARGSHPALDQNVPTNAPVGIGVFARVERGVVTVSSAVYVASGSFSAVNYKFGAVYEGRVIHIPTSAYMKATTV